MLHRFGTLPPAVRLPLLALLYAVSWVAAFRLAEFFEVAPRVSAWFPPAGVTMAAPMVFGFAAWPFQLLVPLIWPWIDGSAVDAGTVVLAAIRQVGLYGGGGCLLRYGLGVRVPFRRARDVRLFLVVATGTAFLSSVFGLYDRVAADIEGMRALAPVFMSYWIGTLSGCLFAAPPLLGLFAAATASASVPPGDWRMALTARRLRGLAAVLAVAVLIAAFERVFQTSGEPWLLMLIPIYLYALDHGFGAACFGVVAVDLAIVVLHQLWGLESEPAQLQMVVLMVGAASLLIGASISERRQAEVRLRLAERTQADLAKRNHALATAIEQSPVGVAIVDALEASLRIQYANASFSSLAGGGNPVGAGLLDLFDSRTTAAPLAEALRRDLRGGHRCSAELIAGGESSRHLAIDVAPVRRGDTVEALVVVLADITGHRAREAAERERERLVSLGHLAGGIAHEINNLLHPIVNLAVDAIEDQANGTADVRPQLRIIETCGRKASDIVRNVLRFARGEPRAAGLRTIVAQAVDEAIAINHQALPPGVTIEWRCEAVGAVAAVGGTEVIQVLTNLIRNALQALDGDGRIQVSLDYADCARDPPRLRLAVADNGRGMEDATRQRLFDPFFTTRGVGEGTGLGLSVVHGIVRDWRGYITVACEPGRGTVFSIVFPAEVVGEGE
jgi:two-component system, cell cycle sensor histidine kinase and response regulator CckA